MGKRTDLLAMKAKQRNDIKEAEKIKKQLSMIVGDVRSQVKESFNKNRTQQLESQFKKRHFEERYIFVLADHQDLFSLDNLKLIKVEINHRLCRMIP